MKLNKPRLERTVHLAKAAASHATWQGTLDTINKTLEEWGGLQPINWLGEQSKLHINLDLYNNKLSCSINVQGDSLYDKLLDSSLTGMSMNYYSASFAKVNHLVNWGTTIHIFFTFSCEVPDEDLGTLRLIGKIKQEEPYIVKGDSYIECGVT